ncbi:AAA family ATPase [Mucilaginibacter sp. E4BP6]|uniref:AAA family ATPase n=1 Tax=Mucilaginibacter sp. E4BP6 TaxID=2723089 RepID=UPI0015CA2B56|nr:AAA family ATPase [Mucilaginibacter sp. E4BP6]NYE65276.1 energy-coupling factor transporter ATP-binding protein EcfA2 [Mucilaginibacter sp. E4BP6]
MNILTDIITWAETKSKFWQMGIDRLIRNNDLTTADIEDLKNACRAEAGLSRQLIPSVDFKALKTFVSHSAGNSDVLISKIYNVENINALSATGVLDFAQTGMTVVYGDNGAGKSSYVSILKHVCNTRGQKPSIHDNIFNPASRGKDKKASVEFSADKNTFSNISLLNGTIDSSALKGVDVFDTSSAHHYIDGEDEIAFIPQGLSYIERLANTLQQIEKELNIEIANLNRTKFDVALLNIIPATKAGRFLASLNKNTTLDQLRAQAQWSLIKTSRIIELEKIISELKGADPQQTLRTNLAKINRFKILRNKFDGLENKLIGEISLKYLVTTLNEYVTTFDTLKAASESIFTGLPIANIGGQSWKQLWESARKFYDEGHEEAVFPETGYDSSCPLCLQDLSPEAKTRFKNFEDFVKHDTQQSHDKAKIAHEELKGTLNALVMDFEDQAPTCLELETHVTGYQDDQVLYLNELKTQRTALVDLLALGKAVDSVLPPSLTKNCKTIIDNEIIKLEAANEVLKTQSITDVLVLHENELLDLKNEKTIFDFKPKLAREIYRQKKASLLNTCVTQCGTRTVTTFSNQLASTYVTTNLRQQFQDELNKLGFRSIKIETETKGVKGKQYHYLRLNEPHGQNIALKDILSEGEHRCIALSTFMSELALSDHKSAIVFDDPVSSLDHKWRDKIAKRVAEEANVRQVIVFTHDITFLLMLQEHCEKSNCGLEIKSLTRKREETGIIASNPPWDALPVNKRLGILKDNYQKLEKIERTDTEEKYKINVQHLYGKLRETWERFIEEVFLNGAVQRFGREIQTQRLSKLTDLTDADYKKVDDNMGKCSTYFLGHDSAGALMQQPPPSSEFQDDITLLENFVKEIRNRRK